ncbi:site-specific integrase [Empedobacter falsenii]|uniref:site-specific integrase n=1 Tax=Empedobacter sp. TaxID=1927715 RepID=UPI0028A59490|nr:site-specific integrase [Empedobacter sp.]
MILTEQLIPFGTKQERKRNIFRPMNYKFVPHNYVRKSDGKVTLLLDLSQDGKRHKEAVNDIYIDPKKWNTKKQRLSSKSEEDITINSILDEVENRILTIKNKYVRDGLILTIPQFIDEYTHFNSYIDFISFLDLCIEEDKKILRPNTIRQLESISTKLSSWRKQIPFYTIDEKFFKDYTKYCSDRENVPHTIQKNIKIIKKYLKRAKKKGIKFPIELDDIKIKKVASNRTDLTILEVRKLLSAFWGNSLSNTQHHALGLFLFSCYTGLRYQDLADFRLTKIYEDVIILRMNKVDEPLKIPLTPGARRIAYSIDWDKKMCYQVALKFLKLAAIKAKVFKHISFHVARHTFASNYVRTDGNITKLSKLLGHKNLATTMIYVHLNNTESDEHIYTLDNAYSYNNVQNKQS